MVRGTYTHTQVREIIDVDCLSPVSDRHDKHFIGSGREFQFFRAFKGCDVTRY